MKEKKFIIKTFGCKVNQTESAFMASELYRRGYREAQPGDPVGVCIVHGCAVTSRASYEARQALYQFHRKYPGAIYVFAGCAANYEGIAIAKRHLATHILGNIEKLDLVDFIEKEASLQHPLVANSDPRGCPYKPMKALYYDPRVMTRSRVFIKIQDGCDAFCSYCVVPYIRGYRRSLKAEEVALQIQDATSVGYNEVVLTGIHLGQWGQDFSPSKTILDLLRFLENSKSVPPKLRLSSLEPSEWDHELIDFLRDKDWFCPHFHVPLQSGDPQILKLMGRNYSPDFYKEVIEAIRSAFPHAAIGADVIVGFPGETDKMFKNTLELVESLPLTYLHVFPYSPREGTPAVKLHGNVSPYEVQLRTKKLREIGASKKRSFMVSQLSRKLVVILERPLKKDLWKATSENYLPLLVPVTNGEILLKGALVKVTVEKYDSEENILIGSLA